MTVKQLATYLSKMAEMGYADLDVYIIVKGHSFTEEIKDICLKSSESATDKEPKPYIVIEG